MPIKNRSYLSPRWTNEIVDCALPMTFDQYSNCGYNCVYCFSQYRRTLGAGKEAYRKGEVSTVNVKNIKDLFLGKTQRPPKGGIETSGLWQFAEFVRQRKAIQWGGLSDPFCVYEKRYGVGLELIRFFREIDYQVTFSTKGVWWADDERYLSQFRGNPNFCLKVSIITGDDAKAKAIERGVPSTTARLKMIEKVAKVMPPGRVVLRLRPFIIGVSNPGHEQLIRDAASAGASSVSTEFFCLETRCNKGVLANYKRISDLVGYDIRSFYKRNSHGGGYQRLNRAIKKRYIDEMESAARSSGMRFFVSDAHYKERSDSGCCCGVPEDWNYSRGQLLSAVCLAKENGRVRFSEIEHDLSYADTFGFRRAHGYNSQSEEKRAKFYNKTMKDFLRWNWNSPNNSQSPYRFYGGILVPDGVDENGDVIYRYDYDRAGK